MLIFFVYSALINTIGLKNFSIERKIGLAFKGKFLKNDIFCVVLKGN